MGNENQSSSNESNQTSNNNSTTNQTDSKNYYDIDETIKESAYKLEEEILSKFCSELNRDQIYFEDVPITIKNYENMYMRTLCLIGKELNQENCTKKVFIMLHGYQACNLVYYRIIKCLAENYIIFCPDFLGMGLSSRPKIEFTNENECIDFFVEVIEAFRKAKSINKFYICGHSLGGYFSGNYAIKYPQNLEDTIFLFSALVLVILIREETQMKIQVSDKSLFLKEISVPLNLCQEYKV
jgi:pimeloyl-ACP methyl ester carboxylesterase